MQTAHVVWWSTHCALTHTQPPAPPSVARAASSSSSSLSPSAGFSIAEGSVTSPPALAESDMERGHLSPVCTTRQAAAPACCTRRTLSTNEQPPRHASTTAPDSSLAFSSGADASRGEARTSAPLTPLGRSPRCVPNDEAVPRISRCGAAAAAPLPAPAPQSVALDTSIPAAAAARASAACAAASRGLRSGSRCDISTRTCGSIFTVSSDSMAVSSVAALASP
mmetsp:Transcript_48891/g.163149  ORF Transcript_48891/g.163149 Transcript_48891/m.163149 type:complete len:223 (+) Transcript_48891:323-991(+)